MSLLRKVIGKVARKVLPSKMLRTLRRPLLVPGYYRNVLRAFERIIDLKRDPRSLPDDYWAAKLRQFAHILDKGIQHCDYELGHSSAYYQKAKQALSMIESEEVSNDPSVQWARGRIKEWEDLQKTPGPGKSETPPVETRCSSDHLMDAILSRRSLRIYRDQLIDDQTMRKIVRVIDWAPSSCNRQSSRVFATNDPDMARRCMKTCVGATCFSPFVPAFFCFCADLMPYDFPGEVFVPAIDVALGVQNCCLIAHSLGISITLLTWGQHNQRDEADLRGLLGIPEHCQIVVNGVAGYPRVGSDVPQRKAISTTLTLVGGSKGT